MALTLYFHPLSSCCHKVLIALYEMQIPFEKHFLNLGDAKERSDLVALWPTGKMPVLRDGEHVVPETTIIIEYLTQHHASGQQGILPSDHEACLEVRLMDRLIDLYVMTPMQAIVGDRLRAEGDRDPTGVAKARATLGMAYGMLEQRLAGRTWRTWIGGNEFSMADCAAAPSLFYATTLEPLTQAHPRLAAYFERLVSHPAVARTLEEAKPYLQFYPYREAMPTRFMPGPQG